MHRKTEVLAGTEGRLTLVLREVVEQALYQDCSVCNVEILRSSLKLIATVPYIAGFC